MNNKEPATDEEILRFMFANMNMSNQEFADHFGVTKDRIHDILRRDLADTTCEVMTQNEEGNVVSNSFSTSFLDDPEGALEKEKARRAAFEEEQRLRLERSQVEHKEARRRKYVELALEFEDRDMAVLRSENERLKRSLDEVKKAVK